MTDTVSKKTRKTPSAQQELSDDDLKAVSGGLAQPIISKIAPKQGNGWLAQEQGGAGLDK